MSLRSRTAWISAFLAFFMVLVLPVCWSGALERARALGVAGPAGGGGNNEEERHEHEEHEVSKQDATRRAPPPVERPVVVLVATLATLDVDAIISASVAPVTHPSLFSERRLI